MKKYKSIFKENKESLFEMANLSPSRTGIEKGYIYISTKQGNHGCRIKYFSNLKDQSKMMIVTIPHFKVIEDTASCSKKIKKQVLHFAKINSKKLLDFWNQGNSWTDDEVRQFQDNLKLSDSDLENAKDLII
jgi:3-deoxy-D-manno-octulosonic-acid transferase